MSKKPKFTKEEVIKAIEKYKEVNPDLVLMDITMPEMDGIQALKEIRKIDTGAKVIMCSAMGQQAMVIESIQAGAKDFIVKPFQAERVLEVNMDHDVFNALKNSYENDKEKFGLYTNLLYNQALLIEGLTVSDPIEFTNDICKIMK